MKPLLHMTAKHKRTGKKADFYFYSVKQAKYFNPSFIEWEKKGVYHE